MKNAKTILRTLILAVLTTLSFSCSTDDYPTIVEEPVVEEESVTPPSTGDIIITIDGVTAYYQNAVVTDHDYGWTSISVYDHVSDGTLASSIVFSFEGTTPGEYEDLDGDWYTGNFFYVVYNAYSGYGWSYRRDEFKTESFLVTDLGQNPGDLVAGTFNGLVTINGVDVEFTGEFNFLR